jgi:rare lipoprotein A
VVNDRGPFKKNRLIDLSQEAAKKIGINGLAKVKVEYIGSSLVKND